MRFCVVRREGAKQGVVQLARNPHVRGASAFLSQEEVGIGNVAKSTAQHREDFRAGTPELDGKADRSQLVGARLSVPREDELKTHSPPTGPAGNAAKNRGVIWPRIALPVSNSKPGFP